MSTCDTPCTGVRPAATSHTWFGHPRGTVLIVFTELWERVSYWGLAGMMVLFLTAAPAAGGWGWQATTAMKFYGWYGGLAFVVPVAGAWLANNYLGERRGILWGGSAISFGHLLLAVSVLRVAEPTQWTFFVGLLFIIAGTGLLKPSISSIVAHLYPGDGVRRDEAFAYFFAAIYVGALVGALVPGFLGEEFGWPYGLGAAGAGMALGLAVYLAKQNEWLGDVGCTPVGKLAARPEPLTREEWLRIGVMVVQGVFTALYAAGLYQMFGLLNLYAREQLDRRIGTFEVPTTWMQSVTLASFLICVPLLAPLWRRLECHGRNPSASFKLAAGLLVLAFGYAVLFVGEATRDSGKPSVTWMAAAYLLFGLGDALVWANQLSLASKLAPPRYSSFCVGAWYVWVGVGTWLAGYLGALVEPFSFQDTFIGLAGGYVGIAALLGLLTPLMRRHLYETEARPPS